MDANGSQTAGIVFFFLGPSAYANYVPAEFRRVGNVVFRYDDIIEFCITIGNVLRQLVQWRDMQTDAARVAARVPPPAPVHDLCVTVGAESTNNGAVEVGEQSTKQ